MEESTTFRFPAALPYLEAIVACLLTAALFIPGRPAHQISAAIVVPTSILSLAILFLAARTYFYTLTVGQDEIVVRVFNSTTYKLRDAVKIEVVAGRGAKVAEVSFRDGRRLSIPSYLRGFPSLVATLRTLTNLPKKAWETD